MGMTRASPIYRPREPAELADAIEGKTTAYRNGDIGPITFQAALVMLGISPDDARGLSNKYRDECQKNRTT